MVSRVDKKPVIYGTTFIKVARHPAAVHDKKLLKTMLQQAVGCKVPNVEAADIADTVEDISITWNMFGVDETYNSFIMGHDPDDCDDAVRISRALHVKASTLRQQVRAEALSEVVSKCQKAIFKETDRFYFGAEGAYMFLNMAASSMVFNHAAQYENHKWAAQSAISIVGLQSPYLMLHPSTTDAFGNRYIRGVSANMSDAWELYKKVETVALRLSSRKNILAHSYYSGTLRKEFTASDNILDDFQLPLTGFVEALDNVKCYLICGIRYFVIQDAVIALDHDDCVNLSMLAQCYAKTALYFHEANGYKAGIDAVALGILRAMYSHICSLIDAKKNFADFIRAIHILAQKEFNDFWEATDGLDLGWMDRSANYQAEADRLDGFAKVLYNKCLTLAAGNLDKLNVCFLYHALVGDEMQIEDLKAKVSMQAKKVLPADKAEWAKFLNFCKSYLLCRYLYVYKRKPTVDGDVGQLEASWAARTLQGHFSMPPRSDWGKAWISNDFPWNRHANTWHLECQDVALVVRDSEGVLKGTYARDPAANSELLHSLKYGQALDSITGTDPDSARARIAQGVHAKEVVLTAAPKAENAKPSWKKRVTFSADNEFRKMQSEVDRNCRRAIAFIRGPSLGVNQHLLDSQFASIASCTALRSMGCVASHDISAWSESYDRERKFGFEKILLDMTSNPEMINIKNDWAKIKCVVNKQGCKDAYDIDNSTFQGFDGSACTVLHALILIYCLDTAKRDNIIPRDVKTDLADLIDDCVATLHNLINRNEAMAFWKHLKTKYLALGFEVDDLKSIFSTIKAIFLGKRFLLGGEVASDFKVFVKCHVSYEDPLRSPSNYASDIFGALCSACDANGDPWFIYTAACHMFCLELSHSIPEIMALPPDAVPIYALAPSVESGWGLPSILDWGTNDVVDKRTHFNSIVYNAAIMYIAGDSFLAGANPLSRNACRAFLTIKSQAWRRVGVSAIFSDPSGATRDGPIHVDNLKKHMILNRLHDADLAEPWASLLKWESSEVTVRVRALLIESGVLHAPTLQALTYSMPDSYRTSLLGKAVGSISLLNALGKQDKFLLKRRIQAASKQYFMHSLGLFGTASADYSYSDICCMSAYDRAVMEREEFYALNGCTITDHTYPDPVACFARGHPSTKAYYSPNYAHLRFWDASAPAICRPREWLSNKGLYVPPASKRVWEVTNEYARGWDPISQKIAVGLAVLARAHADGHDVDGLHVYFIKAWNEQATISFDDTALAAIHGSLKRLDANPGKSIHAVAFARNLLTAFEVNLTTVVNAIIPRAKQLSGQSSHLHDILSHYSAMRALTCLHFYIYADLSAANSSLSFNLVLRKDMVAACDPRRMATSTKATLIELAIMDSELPYDLLSAAPELAADILVPTTQYGWVSMINALVEGDFKACDDLRAEAAEICATDQISAMVTQPAEYSNLVYRAADPHKRGVVGYKERVHATVAINAPGPQEKGDIYVQGVRSTALHVCRMMADDQPDHIVAAVVIKSMVWNLLKDVPADQLAALFYHDPDADWSCVARIKSQQFWTTVIREVARHKRRRKIGDVVALALRTLGVSAFHCSSTDDLDKVSQSCASFFGANSAICVRIIADSVVSVAGRQPSDFDQPLSLRVVTSNPTAVNRTHRKKHMEANVTHNRKSLKDRITNLEKGSVAHKGDKRAMAIDRDARMVELRCRKMVYDAVLVTDDGAVDIQYDRIKAKLDKAFVSAVVRQGVQRSVADAHVDPDFAPVTLQDCLDYMEYLGAMAQEAGAHWDIKSGTAGMKLAVQWLSNDSGRVASTKFAISPAEIAPRIYRIATFKPPETAAPPDPSSSIGMLPSLDDDSDDEGIGIEEAVALLGQGTKLSANILVRDASWKQLFTLVLIGQYEPSLVNAALGTDIKDPVELDSLVDAALDVVPEADILQSFPTLKNDYIVCGVVFNDEWLNAAEASQYLVDEAAAAAANYRY